MNRRHPHLHRAAVAAAIVNVVAAVAAALVATVAAMPVVAVVADALVADARVVAALAVAEAAEVVAAAVVAAVDPNRIGEFFTQCLNLTDAYPDHIACPQIVRLLSPLLSDPNTARAITQKGRKTLYERVGGLTILGHYHPESIWSSPHDHGRTWAIYGVVTGKTAMHEYQIIDPPNDKHKGKVKLLRSYWIMPGQAYWFPVGGIHAHQTFDSSKLIRIEGINLWRKELKPAGRHYKLG
jgi:hypothetical protein